jgi:alkanesulfonate monooxygenase SsuD/methylene tetrahydromethanopterin reductase-like flavin-dependent oxidoreductase (luciferase family)
LRYFDKENIGMILKEARRKMIIGNPKEVKEELENLQRLYGADEMMIVTITHQYEDRIKSNELIANEILPA